MPRHSARGLLRSLSITSSKNQTGSQSNLIKALPPVASKQYQCRVRSTAPLHPSYTMQVVDRTAKPDLWKIAELTIHAEGIELSYEGFKHFYPVSDIRCLRLEETLASKTLNFEWRRDRVLCTTSLSSAEPSKILDHFTSVVSRAVQAA